MSNSDQAKADVLFSDFTRLDLRVAVIISAPLAVGTRVMSRILTLDLGSLGHVASVGQFALIDENDLVGRKVIVCRNLGQRNMGPYRSEALVLGTRHPESQASEAQAVPIFAHEFAVVGQSVY